MTKRSLNDLEEEDDEDAFLTIKTKGVDLANLPKINLKHSKRSLKRIKLDGVFGGRNRVLFDTKGNRTTQKEINTFFNQIQFSKNFKIKEILTFENALKNFFSEYKIETKKILSRGKCRGFI